MFKSTAKKIMIMAFCLCVLLSTKTSATPLETIMGHALGDQIIVPIIMYHALEDTPDNKWEITAAEFESDLQYLRAAGYTAVFMQDLIDFVYNGKPLPQKPIVLSFDDGRSPTINIVLPMLEIYDSRISMAIIGKETDHYTELSKTKNIARHPHMTWDDVNIAAESGRVEISCHTYDLHGKIGAKKRKTESEAAYRKRFIGDLQKFANTLHENANLSTNTLVYPLGAISRMSDDVIKEAGYLASLSCNEKNNMLVVGDYDCLYSLNRFLRPPRKSSENFFSQILEPEITTDAPS